MTNNGSPGWSARNTNAIKLRTSDGKRSEVEVRKVEPKLTPEQIEAGLARRAEAKRNLESAASKQQAREAAKLRAKKADEKHAAGGHTPSGWLPANRRKDYVDPLAKDRDPRSRARRK